ncbi:hypothetical protein [Spirosoma aerophilum]
MLPNEAQDQLIGRRRNLFFGRVRQDQRVAQLLIKEKKFAQG